MSESKIISDDNEPLVFVSATPDASTLREVRVPRLVVTDKCIEKCGSLITIATNVVMDSVREVGKKEIYDYQTDIVCRGSFLRVCRAVTLTTGNHNASFGVDIPGEEGHFLSNPGYMQGSSFTTGTVQDVIDRAVACGAQVHTISELSD